MSKGHVIVLPPRYLSDKDMLEKAKILSNYTNSRLKTVVMINKVLEVVDLIITDRVQISSSAATPPTKLIRVKESEMATKEQIYEGRLYTQPEYDKDLEKLAKHLAYHLGDDWKHILKILEMYNHDD